MKLRVRAAFIVILDGIVCRNPTASSANERHWVCVDPQPGESSPCCESQFGGTEAWRASPTTRDAPTAQEIRAEWGREIRRLAAAYRFQETEPATPSEPIENYRLFVDESALRARIELVAHSAAGGGGDMIDTKLDRVVSGAQWEWEAIERNDLFRQNPYAFVVLCRWSRQLCRSETLFYTGDSHDPIRAHARRELVIDAISESWTPLGLALRRSVLPFDLAAMDRCLAESWTHLSADAACAVRARVAHILFGPAFAADPFGELRTAELRARESHHFLAVWETLSAGVSHLVVDRSPTTDDATPSPSPFSSPPPLAA